MPGPEVITKTNGGVSNGQSSRKTSDMFIPNTGTGSLRGVWNDRMPTNSRNEVIAPSSGLHTSNKVSGASTEKKEDKESLAWKIFLDIAKGLGFWGGGKLLGAITNIISGGFPDWGIFFKTIGHGLLNGCNDFFKNIVQNALRIGMEIVNIILPNDCKIGSPGLAGMLRFVLDFFNLTPYAKIIKALFAEHGDQSIGQVFLSVMKDVALSFVDMLKPSALMQNLMSSVMGILEDACDIIIRYVLHLSKRMGTILNCVSAACDGAVDVIAKSLQAVICENIALIVEILADVYGEGIISKIKGKVKKFRSHGLLKNVFAALGMKKAVQFVCRIENKAADFKISALEKEFIGGSGIKGSDLYSFSFNEHAQDEKSKDGKVKQLFDEFTGSADELASARGKAKALSKDDYRVEVVAAGGELVAIPEARIPTSLKNGVELKAQKAHMLHYVVYNKKNEAIYRTPLEEKAKEAIRESINEPKANEIRRKLRVNKNNLNQYKKDRQDHQRWVTISKTRGNSENENAHKAEVNKLNQKIKNLEPIIAEQEKELKKYTVTWEDRAMAALYGVDVYDYKESGASSIIDTALSD